MTKIVRLTGLTIIDSRSDEAVRARKKMFAQFVFAHLSYRNTTFVISHYFPHLAPKKQKKKNVFFVTHIFGKIQTGYLLSQILDISVIMISYMKTNDAITIQYQHAKISKWPLPPSWISTYMPKVELGIIHI